MLRGEKHNTIKGSNSNVSNSIKKNKIKCFELNRFFLLSRISVMYLMYWRYAASYHLLAHFMDFPWIRCLKCQSAYTSNYDCFLWSFDFHQDFIANFAIFFYFHTKLIKKILNGFAVTNAVSLTESYKNALHWHFSSRKSPKLIRLLIKWKPTILSSTYTHTPRLLVVTTFLIKYNYHWPIWFYSVSQLDKNMESAYILSAS